MTITPEQRATLAQTRARMQEFTRLAAGDRDRLATRRTQELAARREHRAERRQYKQDRRALEASDGPVPYSLYATERPIPYAVID